MLAGVGSSSSVYAATTPPPSYPRPRPSAFRTRTSSVGSSGAFSVPLLGVPGSAAFERMKDKVEQMEAEADVSKQLAAATLVQRGGRCCLAPR